VVHQNGKSALDTWLDIFRVAAVRLLETLASLIAQIRLRI